MKTDRSRAEPEPTLAGRAVRKGIWVVVSRVFPIERHSDRVYRLASWFYQRAHAGVALAITGTWRILTGISINPAATIGPDLRVFHGQGVHLGGEAVIGARCTIHQQVTVGGTAGGRPGQPCIGDDVVLGAGAKILGPVKIGDGATVGANAVVTRDVAPGTVVVGIPARPVERTAAPGR